jgi:hypothetical protein
LETPGGGYSVSMQALRLILREHDLHRTPKWISPRRILHALSVKQFG